ncbi:hypothetical protein K2173_016188 [Erythroxylum novogranatense]|uniref:SET domain-containing protein n=1 Tax=Erythroxylum novogranatense TaxID=1862640 RepID=A0AAV8SFP1_9ROSI|nr:hypothetical protein K2173_016188 [Erythroxylum novogranatense]
MEENKLRSTDENIMTGGTCIIVIELSEDDSFFDQKKDLLQSKGFDIREKIEIEGSSSSDQIAISLEKMLQIARIINLDEIELYFGENECSSVEFWSARNEVEALNSVLSLVKSSISGKTCLDKNPLQALQDAIIYRIGKLVEKRKLEISFDRTYKCNKEKCLLEWGEQNGAKTRLEIACIEGAGRGAIATEDLKVGEIALEIPLSIIISEDLICNSDVHHLLEQIDGISTETMLLLWSMKERHNCNSKFKIYFDTLPKEFNTGLSFGVDAIMALDGTLLLEEIIQAKEHLRSQYDELIPALCNNHPDVFPPELYRWEQFIWACELWYSNSMKVMFADGKLRTCLVPVAGFLNHSLHPHVVHYGKVDPRTSTLKFPLSRPCCVGEQLCLSYGNFSSSHLITFYGFLPEGDNPYDVIPLDIDADEAGRIEDCPQSGWTAHMVRGTWLSNNHNIFHYGLPPPLLDYLREARSPTHNKKDTQPNLEIEMEVLQDLHATFSDMMENLGDTDLVDRENTRWDVFLAVQYKNLQRKIVSSVLTACDTGIKLVQNELSKCIAVE